MSKEMQAELYDGENVVMECQFNKIVPVIKLVLGIIFFFLLFIPLITIRDHYYYYKLSSFH